MSRINSIFYVQHSDMQKKDGSDEKSRKFEKFKKSISEDCRQRDQFWAIHQEYQNILHKHAYDIVIEDFIYIMTLISAELMVLAEKMREDGHKVNASLALLEAIEFGQTMGHETVKKMFKE